MPQIKHPLSINFKTLEQYNFKETALDEIVFFEWLVLKRNHFGSEKFFYQQQRIITELGIKRRRLTTIKAKFIDEFKLESETEGRQNITHFTVKNDFINEFVKANIEYELQEDLLFRLLNFKFKGESKKLTNIEIKKADDLIDQLIDIYNEVRTRKTGDRGLVPTELPYSNTTRFQLLQLMKRHAAKSIFLAFQAFSEAQVSGEDRTFHLLNNFSSYNKDEDRFPVFERWLEVFNRNYSYNKNG